MTGYCFCGYTPLFGSCLLGLWLGIRSLVPNEEAVIIEKHFSSSGYSEKGLRPVSGCRISSPSIHLLISHHTPLLMAKRANAIILVQVLLPTMFTRFMIGTIINRWFLNVSAWETFNLVSLRKTLLIYFTFRQFTKLSRPLRKYYFPIPLHFWLPLPAERGTRERRQISFFIREILLINTVSLPFI